MKKGIYNIAFGVFGQIITIILGVFIPRLVLVSFGSEVNGLLNSITQIYAYFALLEAGVGTTTLQALYKPTGENDTAGVNRILSAANIYFKKLGWIYLVAVLLFSTVYPLTISSSLPYSWIFLIILLNGLGGVINFWAQGKYVIFLNAMGKTYISTNLGTFTSALTSVLKIVLLLNGCDVLKLQTVYFAINVMKMTFIEWYIKREYQWIDLKAKPDFLALGQKGYALIHQISGLIFNNIDVVLITYFLGLKQVSVYSMYLMLFTYLNNFCYQVYGGFAYRLGQIYTSDIIRYKKFHDIFEVYYLSVVFSMYTIALIFVLPFLNLYTKGVTDINYIDGKLAFLFYFMNLLSSGRASSIMVVNFAGHFKNTVNQTVIESMINLSVSIVGVKMYGIYGVLIGTIAALLYRVFVLVKYANNKLLNRSSLVTFKRWGMNLLVSGMVVYLFNTRHFLIDSYQMLFLFAVICSIIVFSTFIVLDSVFEIKITKDLLKYLQNRLLKRNA